MKAVLFTGSTGFIGSEILARLLKDERCPKIFLLVRRKPKQGDSLLQLRMNEHKLKWSILDKVTWIETNFEDEATFQKALAELPTQYSWKVLHLAAIIGSKSGDKLQERLNQGVTQDLMTWANKNAQQFFYLSSVVAFGSSTQLQVRSEKHFASSWESFNEALPYYRTKRRAHEWVLANAKVPTQIFCPSIVHGSLESFKDTRKHLEMMKAGKLRITPAGGGNIVSLDKVARVVVNEVLKDFMSSAASQEVSKTSQNFTRLVVGHNVMYRDYFNLYLKLAAEQGLTAGPFKPLMVIPVWFGAFLKFFAQVAARFGLSSTVLQTTVAPTYWLQFTSDFEAVGMNKSGIATDDLPVEEILNKALSKPVLD